MGTGGCIRDDIKVGTTPPSTYEQRPVHRMDTVSFGCGHQDGQQEKSEHRMDSGEGGIVELEAHPVLPLLEVRPPEEQLSIRGRFKQTLFQMWR